MASPSRRGPKLHFTLLLLLVFFLALVLLTPPAHAAKTKPKKAPPPKKKRDSSYSNKGKLFFWLIDPRDNSCLGAQGFGMCDGSTAWIIAERREGSVLVSLLENDKSDMCLERKWCHSPVSPVSIGPCKNCGSKHWSIDQDSRGYVRVSEDKGKNCLVRSKPGGTGKFKRFKNTVEMQHCSIGYTGLLMTEVPFSEGGFLLQAADGMCFEGERFRPCDLRDPKLRWAIGVRFTSSGQGERYFYKAFQPELCLSRTKKGPTLGDCSGWGAKRWSIKGGQLAQGDGDMCVVRNFDNSAGMEKCKEAFEFVSAVPHDPAVTATGGQGGVSKLTQSVPVTAGIGIGY